MQFSKRVQLMCQYCRVCIHRHRREVHDVGADQEGARVITTQSKAQENHNKLYHRWVIDHTFCVAFHSQISIVGIL